MGNVWIADFASAVSMKVRNEGAQQLSCTQSAQSSTVF
jgi:hypothetical protein